MVAVSNQHEGDCLFKNVWTCTEVTEQQLFGHLGARLLYATLRYYAFYLKEIYTSAVFSLSQRICQ